MHISIICFSLTGYTTAEKIQKSLQQCGYTADLFKKSKYLEDSIAENTAVWTGHHFKTDDGLIFATYDQMYNIRESPEMPALP